MMSTIKDSKIPMESRQRYSAALDDLLKVSPISNSITIYGYSLFNSYQTKIPASPEVSVISIDMSEVAPLCKFALPSNLDIS